MSEAAVTTKPNSTWQGAFAAYGQVFEQIKKNPSPALLFIAAYAFFAAISYAANKDIVVPTDPKRASFEGIATLIFLLALPTYGLALADRKFISLKEFMRFDLGKYLSVFAATVLYVLIVVVSILLLIVPAVWTIAWFALAMYVVVDKGTGPVQGLKASKLLSKDHKGKVWGLIGVTILVSIGAGLVGAVPLIGPAASAFASVLSAGAFAVLYRWLQTADTAGQQE